MYKFKTYGKIKFDPVNMTDKQEKQSKWKKFAMIDIDRGDLASYYAWFLKRRYNITLMKPLRGSHITIINDSFRDMGDGLKNWNKVKKEWDGKEVEITLLVKPFTVSIKDDRDKGMMEWWLIIPNEERQSIHYLRSLVGLGRPNFGLHMTIGQGFDFKQPNDNTNTQRAKEMNYEQSKYIRKLYYQNGYEEIQKR